MTMSNGSVQTGKVRIGILAMLTGLCLLVVALFGASNAKAGGSVGDEIAVDFNYVGIDVNTVLGGVSDLVLTPDAALGELELRGNFNSGSSGAFTVPQTGGLNFPNLALDLGGIDLEAQIALTEDASGTYDPTTGAMTFNPSISLNIGVSDIAALPIPGLGTGPLRCELAPLAVALSTSNGWPAQGNTFDTGPGTLKNGAAAGAWDVKPAIVALEGPQATCDLIGSLLEPVGGLWLAQSDSLVSALPAATSSKPEPAVCGDGFTGDPPNCVAIPPKPAKIALQSKPKGVAVKRGRSGVVRVTVRNTGEVSAAGVKVCGTISSKVAKKPRCVTLGSIAGGKSKTASIRLATSRKAKGRTSLKIRVTSNGAGSASSSATVTIR
jgi:hypothetical protein